MALSDYRKMTPDELVGKAAELRAEVNRLQMARNARRLDRTSDYEATKRELARVLTIAGEKSRADKQGAE